MPRTILDDDLSNCPNAILAGFLRDWWEEAKDHNARSASAYKRAYESMKAYPIKFDHPHEAVILKGIKDVLAKRMTEQYDKYCVAAGLPKPRKPGRSLQSITNQRPGDFGPTEPINIARRNRPKKPYVPTQGSGSYALLRALYESFQLGERVTKDQLQLRAAPYSRTSFEAPAQAGGYYTAWAGMKKLKEEGLVLESGHPKKYEISDAGLELWDKIVAVENGRVLGVAESEGSLESRNEVEEMAPAGNNQVDPPSPPRAPAKRKRKPTAPALEVISLDDEEEDDAPPPPQRRRISPSASAMSASRTGRPHNLGDAFGELQDDSDSDFDSGATAKQLKMQRAAMRERYRGVAQEYQPTGTSTRLGEATSQSTTTSTPVLSTDRPMMMAPEHIRAQGVAQFGPRHGENSSTTPGLARSTTTPSIPAQSTSTLTRTISLPPTFLSTTSGLGGTFPLFAPECLRAGTYEIELILDNREVRSRHDRDYLQNNLDDLGVHPLTRALQIGDVLWIAKERAGLQREVVLDYIVERKRLDDLVGSIKDGRYREQKFRLLRSKIKNIIYIVEDAKLNENDRANMLDSVYSAIAGTMVCDGFFVKRTSKLDDTIRYLVLMTQRLKREYMHKDLYITPPHLVDIRTYSSLLQHLSFTYPARSFHPSYTTFSTLCQKTGASTLRDIFLRLLLCTRGLGVEKAVAIQRVFPTPAALVKALRDCGSREEREGLLVRECDKGLGLVAGRRIGAAVGRKVADVWWGEYGRSAEEEEEEEEEE